MEDHGASRTGDNKGIVPCDAYLDPQYPSTKTNVPFNNPRQ